MVSFTVRMKFTSEDHHQVREILTELAKASRQEPGCISYIPHFLEDDPETVMIYEQYKDDEALNFHRNTPHFQQYAVGGLYQMMRDRVIENLTAVI
ncbi:MAG: putative quinol monooxygenase [Acidobacteriaceae bacterium]